MASIFTFIKHTLLFMLELCTVIDCQRDVDKNLFIMSIPTDKFASYDVDKIADFALTFINKMDYLLPGYKLQKYSTVARRVSMRPSFIIYTFKNLHVMLSLYNFPMYFAIVCNHSLLGIIFLSMV